MKAITFVQPLVISAVDIGEPRPGAEDVLIDVRYVGLCGSDLNAYRGLSPMVSYPRIPGHEISGTIIAKGGSVPDRVRMGTQVTVSPYTACGLCPACRAGRPNCCEFNQTLGVQRDGALTLRIATHYTNVYTSPLLTLEELALVEPLSVGYHAANRARITETDTVLLLGCGTVGTGAMAAAARKGATVIAADIDDAKLANARKYGAQITVNSAKEDLSRAIADLTQGEGVNVVIEAVGLAQTYRMAIDLVAFAGRVVYIGYAKAEVAYDTKEFVRKELDILGSRNALRAFPAVIKMLEQRRMPFGELISRVYPFANASQAFRDWDTAPGSFAKILVDVRA